MTTAESCRQPNQTDGACAAKNRDAAAKVDLRSGLSVLRESVGQDSVDGQETIPGHLPAVRSERAQAGEPTRSA
jgi:hypothetical protein